MPTCVLFYMIHSHTALALVSNSLVFCLSGTGHSHLLILVFFISVILYSERFIWHCWCVYVCRHKMVFGGWCCYIIVGNSSVVLLFTLSSLSNKGFFSPSDGGFSVLTSSHILSFSLIMESKNTLKGSVCRWECGERNRWPRQQQKHE